MAMKNITAAQWDAIAWAQGSFGIPDSVVGKMMNCPAGTVRTARLKGGWEVRDLTKAHSGLTGWLAAEGRSGARHARWSGKKPSGLADLVEETEDREQSPAFPPREDEEDSPEGEDPELVLERLTTAISRNLQAAADGTLDASVLKKLDALVAAARTYEKLVSMKEKAAGDPAVSGDAQVVADKAKLLGEMDKRIDELAERRAKEIETGRAGPNPD